MLTIVGGTYIENCREPSFHEIFGSGLRAAIALSSVVSQLKLVTCCGNDYEAALNSISATFGIKTEIHKVAETISFNYDHPMAKPFAHPNSEDNPVELPPLSTGNVLYYGMNESSMAISADYLVYDPQNWKSFGSTGSKANHLALILNKREAAFFSGMPSDTEIKEMGRYLLQSEHADVIVIKNGSSGALVIEAELITVIPVYETESVWPIGSGDIFSAVFAWRWVMERDSAVSAADLASRYTASYCESRRKTLPLVLKSLKPLMARPSRKVYLASPFFSMGERWLLDTIRNLLLEFGNDVFSPLHDVGLGIEKELVEKDIERIRECNVLLAVLHGLDPGTLFEIGYARALGKKVVVFAENVSPEDMAMLSGTECEIVFDLSSAIYKASW